MKDNSSLLIQNFNPSYDVVFAIDSERLLKRFNDFNANVLFSAEAFCWPDDSLTVI